jgi:hypothetical protein
MRLGQSFQQILHCGHASPLQKKIGSAVASVISGVVSAMRSFGFIAGEVESALIGVRALKDDFANLGAPSRYRYRMAAFSSHSLFMVRGSGLRNYGVRAGSPYSFDSGRQSAFASGRRNGPGGMFTNPSPFNSGGLPPRTQFAGSPEPGVRSPRPGATPQPQARAQPEPRARPTDGARQAPKPEAPPSANAGPHTGNANGSTGPRPASSSQVPGHTSEQCVEMEAICTEFGLGKADAYRLHEPDIYAKFRIVYKKETLATHPDKFPGASPAENARHTELFTLLGRKKEKVEAFRDALIAMHGATAAGGPRA